MLANHTSRHRKPERLATTRHIDGGKAGDRKPTAGAVALFIDLELALAGAKLGHAAPVQGFVLDLESAVVRIDSFREAENSPRLSRDIRMQALAGIDAIPAAADHGFTIIGRDRGHDLMLGVVAPG